MSRICADILAARNLESIQSYMAQCMGFAGSYLSMHHDDQVMHGGPHETLCGPSAPGSYPFEQPGHAERRDGLHISGTILMFVV